MRRNGTWTARLGLLPTFGLVGPALLIGALGLGVGVSGCRVNQDDLHRWESTERGPDKIKAVLAHDKYELPLRIEAAVSLIRMKPRNGRYVGLEKLLEGLHEIPKDQRAKILEGLVPLVIAELRKDPPAAQAGQPAPPDPSFSYKDSAYALINSEEGEALVEDEKMRDDLRASLKEWAMKDFDRRLENRAQKFGMEQLLKSLGPFGVDQLPEKITLEPRNLEKLTNLIAEIGSDETKELASAKLVEVVKYVISTKWVETKRPQLEAANEAANLKPTKQQVDTQVEEYQDEEMQRVLGTLKKMGGRPAIEYALELGSTKTLKPDRRVWALAALELRLDPKNNKDIERIFAIATDEDPKTTDAVKDLAFARIAEMERAQVIDKLWAQFTKTEKWKVRAVLGDIIFRMSDKEPLEKLLPTFMGKLPEKDAKGFALTEAALYGDYLGDYPKIREQMNKYLPETATTAQRAVAFSFYMKRGEPKDVKVLEPYRADKTALPTPCEGEHCKWECYVPKDEKKPEEAELKEVKTFGEFVVNCVEREIKRRDEEAKKTPAPKENK